MKTKRMSFATLVAMTGLLAGAAWAQTTTFTGTAGAYNNDTWNQLSGGLPQYWNNGIPSGAGPWEVIIATGSKVYVTSNYLSVGESPTPAYTGNLTLQANAYVEIASGSIDADLFALGTGTITFNLGSRLAFRRNANTVHNQNIALNGNASIDLCLSTDAHVRSRTFNGVISGSGKLDVYGVSRNTLILTASNPLWSGGLLATNGTSMVTGNGAGCFGTGNVTINNSMSLKISVANTIDDGAALYLSGASGTDAGTAAKKLVMNASDTVNMLVKDGYTYPAGAYTSTRPWIQGTGTLTVLSPSDTTAPLVSSFTDNVSGGPIPEVTDVINYTVAFADLLMDELTINTNDFGNAGTATVTIGTITQLSATNFNVAVYVESAGSIQLKINAGADIKDMAGIALDTTSAILDDTTITVTPFTPESNKPRMVPTLNGVASTNVINSTVSLIFNASGSDKLVVVVTGEDGNSTMSGNCSSVKYDGVSLTRVVDRNPIPSNPIVTYNDYAFNDIWYLDNPGSVHTSGAIVATVVSHGIVTAFALSDTAPGVGATAISPQMSKYVKLGVTSKKSIVIASHGMGGDGNTANVDLVDTVAPLIETSARKNSTYSGHVTGYMVLTTSGIVEPTYTGGNVIGTHTIAAEFPGKLLPSGTVILLF